MTNEPDHRMSMREFCETGCVQEVNRRLLHPRGLALIVVEHYGDDDPDHKGPIKRWSWGGIMDYRDDPDGIRYSDEEINAPRTLESFHAFERLKDGIGAYREKELGWVAQPLPLPDVDGAGPLDEVPPEEQLAHWQRLWSSRVALGRDQTATIEGLRTELEQARTGAGEPEDDAGEGAGPDDTGWEVARPYKSFLALRFLYITQGRELRRTKSLLAAAEEGEKKPAAGYGSEPAKLEPSAELDEMVEICRDAFVAGLKAFAFFDSMGETVGNSGVPLGAARAKAFGGLYDNDIHLAVTAGQDRRGTS